MTEAVMSGRQAVQMSCCYHAIFPFVMAADKLLLPSDTVMGADK